MTEYVCGFLFNVEHKLVLLIWKTHPEWQKGKCNGVGGHVEMGESPEQAMRREAYEEAGLEDVRWEEKIKLIGHNWTVHFFRAEAHQKVLLDVRSKTDEYIGVKWYDQLPKECIPNLNWLIPMLVQNEFQGVVTIYNK